jgi:FkbM family methyltransferase
VGGSDVSLLVLSLENSALSAANRTDSWREGNQMPLITCSFSRGAAQSLQMKMDLDPNRPNESTILGYLQTGISFESDVANLLVRTLGAGDVAVDIGANIGFLTVLAAMLVGPSGHVVAFEPDPENLARLRANLAHNECQNVTVIEKAVTNQVGDIEFFINSDDSGGNALWDPAQYPGNVKCVANPIRLTVPGTTLDAEWERLRLPAPKVIKIDTEGAEQRVLEGMRDLLSRQKPRFVVAELHMFGLAKMGCSQESLRGFMGGLGYSTFGLTFAGALPRFIPAATRIEAPFTCNLLFSKPEWVGEYWPTAVIDPRDLR